MVLRLGAFAVSAVSLFLFVLVLGFGTSTALAQSSESSHSVKKMLLAVVSEPKLAAIDLVTFRRPAFSFAMLADFAAIGLDMAATSDRVSHCRSCSESGSWRWFIGSRPAPHKVYLMGIGEAVLTMTSAHYIARASPRWPVRISAVGLPTAQAVIHAYYADENWRLIANCKRAKLYCY
jgi:hypothetical protein